MLKNVTKQEYATAVIALTRLAYQCTSGGRVAAQILLSAYNGEAFQLDVASMGNLDSKNYEIAMTVIRGRYETGIEPHYVLRDGDKIFRDLWNRWSRLHVEERGKQMCPTCKGRGQIFVNPDDEEEMQTKPCSRCKGTGRVCGCGK